MAYLVHSCNAICNMTDDEGVGRGPPEGAGDEGGRP